MPRTHIIQSWVGAAEYDEGDTYSGEQIGNRNQKSIGVHITRSGDQWYANTNAYSEEAQKARSVKPKKTAFQAITLADSHYERLCSLSEALDVQLENKELSLEDWAYARKQLDKRLEKAWSRLCKERGWNEDGTDNSIDTDSLVFNTKDFEIVKKKSYDFSIIPQSSIFHGLSDENSIKKIYTNWLTVKEMLCRVWDVSKQIVEQGLL